MQRRLAIFECDIQDLKGVPGDPNGLATVPEYELEASRFRHRNVAFEFQKARRIEPGHEVRIPPLSSRFEVDDRALLPRCRATRFPALAAMRR